MRATLLLVAVEDIAEGPAGPYASADLAHGEQARVAGELTVRWLKDEMTSGSRKKSRTCDRADGTLSGCPLGWGQAPRRQPVRRIRRAKVPGPAPGVGRACSPEDIRPWSRR